MSLRSEIQKALFCCNHALSCPVLFHLSCDFLCALTEVLFKHKGILPPLTRGWRESGFIVGQPKLPENLLKLFWEVSGKFSKHSNSEEVLFKLKKKSYVVSMENPTGLFPIDHARKSDFSPRSHSLKYCLNIILSLSFGLVV